MAKKMPINDSSQPQSSEGKAREPLNLDDLLAHYVEKLNAGESLDSEAILESHPDVGPEIIGELETYVEFELTDDPSPPLGTLGDYTLRRQIGRGGMGVVYEAWENSMDRRVALKVLPAGIAADTRASARFMREAQAAGKLRHQNIVGVYSTGVKEGTPWYSMEFVEGETLAEILARLKEAEESVSTPFGASRDKLAFYSNLADVFADVADGLQHAHSKGVVHRDIKPSNLVLDTTVDPGRATGRLRILDFGLAHLEGQESLTLSGDIVGTPLYMSPEQARRRKIPIDHRTDIYSLGATIYELVAEQPPFRGKDNQDTLSQIISRDPQPLCKLNRRVPNDLETIVLKCLRKDPGDRYGTAEALAQDLRRFSRGDPIEARPQSKWERLGTQVWRHRVRFLVGGVLGLLSIASVALLMAFFGTKRAADERRYRELVFNAAETLQGQQSVIAQGNPITPLFAETSWNPAVNALARAELENARLLLEEAVALFPSRPDAYYHLARSHVLAGRYQEALALVSLLRDQSPQFVAAATLEAAVHLRLGDREQAAKTIERAMASAETVWKRTFLRAQQAASEGRWVDAKEAYTIVLREGGEGDFIGSTFELRIGRAVARIKTDDYVAASRDLQAAKTIWDKSLVPVFLLGRTYLLQGLTREAESFFQESFKETSRKDEFAVEVADLFFYAAVHDKAFEWLDRAQQSATREKKRILFHVLRNDPETAIVCGEKALRDFPQEGAICALLSLGYREQGGNLRRAEELETRAMELCPKDLAVLSILALASASKGNWQQALDFSDRALKVAPTFDVALIQKVWALNRLGRLRDALSVVEELARRHPEDAFIHDACCSVMNHLGLFAKTEEHGRKAIELNPKFPHPYMRLAGRASMLGAFEESERLYRQAFEIDPSHRWSKWLLADNLDLQGRFDEALRLRCEALLEAGTPPWIVHWRFAESLRWNVQAKDLTPLDDYIEQCARHLNSASLPPRFHQSLALAYVRAPKRKDVWKALSHAEIAVEQSGGDDPAILATLAVAQHANGELVEAIQTLEAAVRHPDARVPYVEQLNHYRRQMLPTLVSPESVDWALEQAAAGQITREDFLETVHVLDSGQQAEAPVGYLKARLLQRETVFDQATVLFRDLNERAPTALSTRRLGECLRARGEVHSAIAAVEEGLKDKFGTDRALWELWWTLALQGGTETESLLDRLPRVFENAATREEESHSYGDDFRWLLQTLAAEEELRINCGGDDYERSQGVRWSRDRFYLGGRSQENFEIEMHGTDDPILYQQYRDFPEQGVHSGYRIPLPSNDYQVSLHFAESRPCRPGPRSFDVFIEDTRVLEKFRPYDLEELRPGVVHSFSFDVAIDDEFLDIKLRSRLCEPRICAIEVKLAR